MLFLVACAAPVHSALRYDVTYAGILSGMRSLDIADAILSEERAGSDGLIRGDLTISSFGHESVEVFFPFRYRVRSLYRRDGSGMVAFEHYKHTRRVKHEVFVADPERGKLFEYRPGASGAALPEAVAAFLPSESRPRLRGDGLMMGADSIFDRLSLIQHIRTLPLKESSSFEIAATDGDERFVYRVKVIDRELQHAAGRQWDTWRLKLDAFKENGERVHWPVHLWLDVATGHKPIKAEARHDIGQFSLMLAELNATAEPRKLLNPGKKSAQSFTMR